MASEREDLERQLGDLQALIKAAREFRYKVGKAAEQLRVDIKRLTAVVDIALTEWDRVRDNPVISLLEWRRGKDLVEENMDFVMSKQMDLAKAETALEVNAQHIAAHEDRVSVLRKSLDRFGQVVLLSPGPSTRRGGDDE